ncbi:MAG: hypothetical protein WCS98_06705, partial [Bacillota bacterium]
MNGDSKLPVDWFFVFAKQQQNNREGVLFMNCFKWGICLKKFTVCVLVFALILGGGLANFTAYADNATNGQ